jgi:hypothetical protein
MSKALSSVCFLQLVTPPYKLRIFFSLIKLGPPERIFLQQEGKNLNPFFDRGVIFKLRDASHLTIRHITSAKRDEQDAQMTASKAILRKLFWFVAIRRPILHRIHEESRATQGTDDMSAMILEVFECRGDKGLIDFHESI